MPARPTEATTLDPVLRQATAVELFNYTWTLLEKPERSPSEDELMVHAAHASRFHWEDAGDAANHARGEWQLARVYAVLGRAEPALHHARRCLELCREHGLGGFDLPYAYEALARAHAVAGEHEEAGRYRRLAEEAATAIDDADDRELLLADLATVPGPGSS